MNNYHHLPQNYDRLQPREEIFRQEPFFRTLIEEHGIRTCLDCSCGTGWHLQMISKMGVDCCGSDLSEEMLQKARENLKDQPVDLKQENFRSLENSWQQTFDMIICMSTSLPHNKNDQEATEAVRSMFNRLNPDGILVIDMGMSDRMFREKPRLIPARLHEDQAFYFFLEYPDVDHVIFNILNVVKTPEGFDHAFSRIEYAALTRMKMESYLSAFPFATTDFFEDYWFTPWSEEHSGRMVIVARK
jgi:glycine/sarcosine N-methyltransferase